MRSVTRQLLTAALALSLAACNGSHEPKGPRVTVLFTTDEHSHLFAVAPEIDDFDVATGGIKTTVGKEGKLKGGIARRATILAVERNAAAARGSEGTLTFSAGDYSQGSLSGAAHLMTAPDLVALKRLGYDAVAIGNHEFDVGPLGLAVSIQQAGADVPPLVLTNAVFSSTDPGDDQLALAYGPTSAIAPYRVITLQSGRKIGVVAVMGVGAGTDAVGASPLRFWDTDSKDPAARMASIIGIVQPVVNALRTDHGASAVIVLGHGGIGPKFTTAGGVEPGDDEKLAMGLSGVDLVVSGHSHSQGTRAVVGADGRHVPVVQTFPYGDAVGRVDLVFDGDRPVLDPEQIAYVPVDDRTAPTTDAAIVGDTGPLLHTIDVLETLFLPGTLTTVLGAAPTHTARGDLYYKQIGKTDFDIRGLGGGESNAMNLDTDAMLDTMADLGLPTEVALQNYGSIRADLPKGDSGALSFADLYRVVPNGIDPTVASPTPGLPLVRVGLWTFALRAALEGTLLYSVVDGDYFLGGSGIKVRYDTSRPKWDQNPFAPGWITSISLVASNGTETTIYDVGQTNSYFIPYPIWPVAPGATIPTNYVVNPMDVRTVVSTYFVAAFADAFSIPLLSPAGVPITAAQLPSMVVTWDATAGGPRVKDHQSLARYVYGLSCPTASRPCDAGTFTSLPARYDASAAEGHVPRRIVDCTGGLCP